MTKCSNRFLSAVEFLLPKNEFVELSKEFGCNWSKYQQDVYVYYNASFEQALDYEWNYFKLKALFQGVNVTQAALMSNNQLYLNDVYSVPIGVVEQMNYQMADVAVYKITNDGYDFWVRNTIFSWVVNKEKSFYQMPKEEAERKKEAEIYGIWQEAVIKAIKYTTANVINFVNPKIKEDEEQFQENGFWTKIYRESTLWFYKNYVEKLEPFQEDLYIEYNFEYEQIKNRYWEGHELDALLNGKASIEGILNFDDLKDALLMRGLSTEQIYSLNGPEAKIFLKQSTKKNYFKWQKKFCFKLFEVESSEELRAIWIQETIDTVMRLSPEKLQNSWNGVNSELQSYVSASSEVQESLPTVPAVTEVDDVGPKALGEGAQVS